ncbi:hypothetical protein NW759_002737 [Fusarium solani]|nr:hypothetical protein NW759_002737 [Fusarium solani]
MLFQEYIEGKLPDYLLKGIFALASLFLAPQNAGDARGDMSEFSELRALSVFHVCSVPWAEDSMRDVMGLIMHEPTLHMVQALECLTLYWFGRGDAWKGDMCHALAYRSCRALAYGQRNKGRSANSPPPLHAELERRCFWSCWASMCIIAQPEPYLRSAWLETEGIPLPGRIDNTSVGWRVVLGVTMTTEWRPSVSGQSQDATRCLPFSASLVKVVGVWAKIQQFVVESKRLTVATKFGRLSDLSSLASAIYQELPRQDHPTSANTTFTDTHLFHMLDALCYMCQMALHSTVVPLFSGSSLDPGARPEEVRNSARKVLTYAQRFATLLDSYLRAPLDVSYISPLVGYGAFITGGVIIAHEMAIRNSCSSGDSFRCSATSGGAGLSTVRAILDLLGALSVYWRVLQTPRERLRAALAQIPTEAACQSAPMAGATNMPENVVTDHVRNQALVGSDLSVLHQGGMPLQPLATIDSAGVGAQEGLAGFTPISTDLRGQDIDQPKDSMEDLNLDQQGLEWWNLTFAEAGFAHFEGLEPLSGFLGG